MQAKSLWGFINYLEVTSKKKEKGISQAPRAANKEYNAWSFIYIYIVAIWGSLVGFCL